MLIRSNFYVTHPLCCISQSIRSSSNLKVNVLIAGCSVLNGCVNNDNESYMLKVISTESCLSLFYVDMFGALQTIPYAGKWTKCTRNLLSSYILCMLTHFSFHTLHLSIAHGKESPFVLSLFDRYDECIHILINWENKIISSLLLFIYRTACQKKTPSWWETCKSKSPYFNIRTRRYRVSERMLECNSETDNGERKLWKVYR